jgi:hypothetical protein
MTDAFYAENDMHGRLLAQEFVSELERIQEFEKQASVATGVGHVDEVPALREAAIRKIRSLTGGLRETSSR